MTRMGERMTETMLYWLTYWTRTARAIRAEKRRREGR